MNRVELGDGWVEYRYDDRPPVRYRSVRGRPNGRHPLRDEPGAMRFGAVWLLPLPLIGDEERQMPETRPDTDAYDHAAQRPFCRCAPCRRPEARRWRWIHRRLAGVDLEAVEPRLIGRMMANRMELGSRG